MLLTCRDSYRGGGKTWDIPLLPLPPPPPPPPQEFSNVDISTSRTPKYQSQSIFLHNVSGACLQTALLGCDNPLPPRQYQTFCIYSIYIQLYIYYIYSCIRIYIYIYMYIIYIYIYIYMLYT